MAQKKEKMVQLNFRVPAALKDLMLLALARLGRRSHGDFSEACREAIRSHAGKLVAQWQAAKKGRSK